MAKMVSLKRFSKWIEENLHMTWYHGPGGGFDSLCSNQNDELKGKISIKYIEPILDTRTMQIFCIKTRGSNEYSADFREEFEGDILDLLKHKIINRIHDETKT